MISVLADGCSCARGRAAAVSASAQRRPHLPILFPHDVCGELVSECSRTTSAWLHVRGVRVGGARLQFKSGQRLLPLLTQSPCVCVLACARVEVDPQRHPHTLA